MLTHTNNLFPTDGFYLLRYHSAPPYMQKILNNDTIRNSTHQIHKTGWNSTVTYEHIMEKGIMIDPTQVPKDPFNKFMGFIGPFDSIFEIKLYQREMRIDELKTWIILRDADIKLALQGKILDDKTSMEYVLEKYYTHRGEIKKLERWFKKYSDIYPEYFI